MEVTQETLREMILEVLTDISSHLENSSGTPRGAYMIGKDAGYDLDTVGMMLSLPGVLYSDNPMTNDNAEARVYVQLPYAVLKDALDAMTAATTAATEATEGVDEAVESATTAAESANNAAESATTAAEVATNATASLKSTLTVGNANSQRIEIIPFVSNQVGSGSINFINAESDKVLKIGFYNDNYGSIDFYSPATKQNPEESEVSVRSNYLQIYSENTDNGKESYITMLTSTNNAYSQYTFDDKVNKMFLTSGVEGGTLMLRAYKPNGSSAWPRCLLDPNGANWMTKGHVHVMTMAELKVLLENPNSIYSSHLANYAVMLTRINGN